MPAWVGSWPALVLFFAFAWFELIDPAPDDPARLAVAVGAYWLLSFVAMLAFGFDRWSRQGEFLSVFFAMIARFGMVEGKTGKGRLRLALCWPGAKLSEVEPLPPSGALFLPRRWPRSPSTAFPRPSSGSAATASTRSNFPAVRR